MAIPIDDPGREIEYMIIIAIITKRAGITILENFPIPLLKSLWEIYHTKNQITKTAMSVGIMNDVICDKSLPPPTDFTK